MTSLGPTDRDAEVDLVLAEYIKRIDRGEAVDPRQLLNRHPHLAAELVSFFDAEAAARYAFSSRSTSPTNGANTAAPLPRDALAHDLRAELPGYEIGPRISRGGMGVVYRGIQLSLGREVALKVLHPSLAGDADALRRFRNEAAIAARLTDSHVLPVFDIAETAGVPVLVMPFVDGCDLGQIIADRAAMRAASPTEWVAVCKPSFWEQVRGLCGATTGNGHARRVVSDDQNALHPPAAIVPHAWAAGSDQEYLERMLPVLDQLVAAAAALHAAGVLHRDIKPSNVLVDRRGNSWLADFGLARLSGQGHTQPGAVLGTKGYMSPEQSAGEEIDERTDVFGLGATLYQALTLELPYGLARIDHHQPLPPLPSKHQKLISRDYDGVILKALEPEPGRRYRNAGELQDDWRRVRQGLTPQARPIGWAGRAARLARRNLWQVAAVVLLGAMLTLLAWPQAPPVPEPAHFTVVAPTTPRALRAVLVPLSDYDGQPRPEVAYRHDPLDRGRLIFRRVAPGDYLLVVDAGEAGFHEVYRRVPRLAEQPGEHDHRRWHRLDDATVELEPVKIRPLDTTGMCRFEGAEDFVMGSERLPQAGLSPHVRSVRPFWLDTHEVSIEQYQAVVGRLPPELAALRPDNSLPITYVSWDDAVQYAERCGKRLPTEAEYEFAATGGGKRLYPWGDTPPNQGDWEIRAVDLATRDLTHDFPPVFGLYSNVTEWTAGWFAPYPGSPITHRAEPDGYVRAGHGELRAVRGGPMTVVEYHRRNPADDSGPRYRHFQSREVKLPRLGFRTARSVAPALLP